MTFDQTKLAIAAAWMLAVATVGLASGITGGVSVLWISALALVPASLGLLLWQQAPQTVSQIIHDTDVAP